MESSNKETWQSMQQRIERVQHRKALIPQINQLKKELLIICLQVAKMEERALDNLYTSKKNQLDQKVDQLKTVTKIYLGLVGKELDMLNSSLEVIKKQRYDPTVYALDLEEHQRSLEKAIALLEEEKEEVKRDTTKAAMARSHIKSQAFGLNNHSGT